MGDGDGGRRWSTALIDGIVTRKVRTMSQLIGEKKFFVDLAEKQNSILQQLRHDFVTNSPPALFNAVCTLQRHTSAHRPTASRL